MMAKPWADAIATIPGRPTPSPTTAAGPAPMNTNEKGPLKSARSLGAIRVGMVDREPGVVGFIGERLARVAVGPHLAVAMVALERAHGCVEGDVVEVHAEPIALRVAVREQPRLEHLVGREPDPGDDVRR